MSDFRHTLLLSLLLHAGIISLILVYGERFELTKTEILVVDLTPAPSGMRGGGGGGGGGGEEVTPPVKERKGVPSRKPGQKKKLARTAMHPRHIVSLRSLQMDRRASRIDLVASGKPEITDSTSIRGTDTGSGGGSGSGIGSGPGSGDGTGGGTGGGTGAGTGKDSGKGAGSSPGDQTKKYLRENFAYIREIIQKNLTYPCAAQRRRLSGTVKVSFVILENGHVTDIKIISSSGYEILDTNVIETIRKVAPFPKPPVRAELHMPISYRIVR